VRRILMALVLAAAAACGDNDSTGLGASVEGTYTLRTINGTALPYVVQSGSTTVRVIDDVITLNLNGTYTETGHTQTTFNGTTTTDTGTDTGTYTTAGTSITLRSNDGTSISGTINSGTLTLVDQGLAAVFTR
jgi:hypothetical protein